MQNNNVQNLEHLWKLLDTLGDLTEEKQSLSYVTSEEKQTKDYVTKMNTFETEIKNALDEIQACRDRVIECISGIEDKSAQQIMYYVYVSRLPLHEIIYMVSDNLSEAEAQSILDSLKPLFDVLEE